MPPQTAKRQPAGAGCSGHLADGVLQTTPLDRESIPQDILDIRDKERSNPLEWKGQFSPQLVETLLAFYDGSNRSVLDPFAGSGTVLLEAARRGLTGVGVEVNPAAYHLAAFYELLTASEPARKRIHEAAEGLVAWAAGADGPLFAGAEVAPQDRAHLICEAWREARSSRRPRGLARYLAALLVLSDISKGELHEQRLLTAHARLSALLRTLPICAGGRVEMTLGDARRTEVASRSVDLVVTSPPYVNVYNYHQKYRGSVEAMGWDVLRTARSEIGSNRKHRGNRVLTVIQYCVDMADVFAEMRRVIKRRGAAVVVVGRESMVRKTRFYNAEMLAEVASRACGLELRRRQERMFLNRFGQDIYEDILHLGPAPGTRAPSGATRHTRAREVAAEVLEDALRSCPPESREDIRAAMEQLEQVRPSPLSEPIVDAC